LKCWRFMKRQCPDSVCLSHDSSLRVRPIVRKGRYFRRSDGQWISRFLCRSCGRSFSSGTSLACYRQKKRKLNHPLRLLLSSGVSQRRASILLRVNRKTVVRKFRFLAQQSRIQHQRWLHSLEHTPVSRIQFDDLETSEHTKCKPLSVALAVDPASRKVLSFQVSQMPAKGHLSQIAFRKYGYRKDERPQGWDRLFSVLKPVVQPTAQWTSDENPHYWRHLIQHHPHSTHVTTPGGRGCVTGQGELKKLRFDPLFALNHTCAMLRANLNRLFRKTWCTTKNRQGLIDHLSIYIRYHNETLTHPCTR
jgi:transposase-like protein